MRTFTWSYLLMLLCAASAAQAQSVVPLKGQSSQQMQLDINDCNTVATNAANGTATSSDPMSVAGFAVQLRVPPPVL